MPNTLRHCSQSADQTLQFCVFFLLIFFPPLEHRRRSPRVDQRNRCRCSTVELKVLNTQAVSKGTDSIRKDQWYSKGRIPSSIKGRFIIPKAQTALMSVQNFLNQLSQTLAIRIFANPNRHLNSDPLFNCSFIG